MLDQDCCEVLSENKELIGYTVTQLLTEAETVRLWKELTQVLAARELAHMKEYLGRVEPKTATMVKLDGE